MVTSMIRDAQPSDIEQDDQLTTLTLSLSRFVRNLVAGNPVNQSNALLAHISNL